MYSLSELPTPIEILLDPISLIVLAVFAGLALWEKVAPGRTLPKVSGWRLRGYVSLAVYFYLSSYLPLIWDGALAEHTLIDLTALGAFGGATIGMLAYQVGAWAWHRSMHASGFLWRTVHQMHHSAERLDTTGAFYFHPLDMVGWTFLGSLVMVGGFGVTPQAATLFLMATTFLGIFQHANIRTPVWLGYIVQRPESHTVHHARGVHAYNYADLPIVDMLFGTFRNPEGFEHETGLGAGASRRVWDMLRFKDVAELPAETREAPAAMDRIAA